MPTLPTLVSYTETGNTNVAPTTGVTTANIAVQVGDLVVIWAGGEDQSGIGTMTLSLLGGLTGALTTHQTDATASYAPAQIGTADVTSAGNLQGKMVGTVAPAKRLNCGVWIYRDHGGVGATGKAHEAAGSAPLLAFTAGANSAVACCTTDWAALNTARTYRQVNAANPTERGHFADGTTWHYDAYDYADTGGAGGSISVGETAPATQKPNTLAVEILGAPSTWSNAPTSLGVTFPSGTVNTIALQTLATAPANSWIFVVGGCFTARTLSGVSGGGLTWEVVESVSLSPGVHMARAWAAAGLASGTTITMTLSGTASDRAIGAVAFTGAGADSVAEGSAVTGAASTAAWTSAVVTDSSTALAVAGTYTTFGDLTNTPDANSVEDLDSNAATGGGGGVTTTLVISHRIAVSAGANTVGGTLSSSGAWASGGRAFSAGTPAGGADTTTKPGLAGQFDPQLLERAWF